MQVEDDDVFCENCGTNLNEKITKNKNITIVSDMPVKKIYSLTMIIIIALIGLLIGVAIWMIPYLKGGFTQKGDSSDGTDFSLLEKNSIVAETSEQVTDDVTNATTKLVTTTEKTTERVTEETTENTLYNYTAYLALLSYFDAEIERVYNSENLLYHYYYLYDINNDGFQELIIQLGDSMAETTLSFYTIDANNLISEIGELNGGGTTLCTKDGHLYTNYGSHGYQIIKEINMIGDLDDWSLEETVISEEDGLSDYKSFGQAINGYDFYDTIAIETMCSDKFIEEIPFVWANVETYAYTLTEGSECRLFVDGDFSYITVQKVEVYGDGGDYPTEIYTIDECEDYINLNFNAFQNEPTYLVIVPLRDDGTSGTVIICDIPTEESGVINTSAVTIPVDIQGYINCHGGVVAGFTTEYVVDGGAVGTVKRKSRRWLARNC